MIIRKNHERIVNKWVGMLIKEGRKNKSEKILFEILRKLKKDNFGESPMNLLKEALLNIIPMVSLVNKKKGGTIYRLPVPVQERRALSIGIRWLKMAVVVKASRGNLVGLYLELKYARNLEGDVIKKRNDLHEIAVLNRAFIKFLG